MSTLNPPIALERPENQARVDYIQDYASGKHCGYAQNFSIFQIYLFCENIILTLLPDLRART